MNDPEILRLHNAFPDFSICKPPVDDVADDVSALLDEGEPLHFTCVAKDVFSRDGLHFEYIGKDDGSAVLRQIKVDLRL